MEAFLPDCGLFLAFVLLGLADLFLEGDSCTTPYPLLCTCENLSPEARERDAEPDLWIVCVLPSDFGYKVTIQKTEL